MTVKSLTIYTLLCVAFSALFWTGYRLYLSPLPTKSSDAPTVLPRPTPSMPAFSLTALQVSDDERRVINCANKSCQPMPDVSAAVTAAVTDGLSWYHYQENEPQNKQAAILQLKRTWINQDRSDLIIEQTELVSPRGLFISPDNKKVAFWLDNTHEPGKKLTELWLYDADSESTKLIAEKIDITGVVTEPRWNRSSSHLWFLGHTSAAKEDNIALHIVSTQPPSITVLATGINWNNLAQFIATEPLDISQNGQSIAYVEPRPDNYFLHLQRGTDPSEATTMPGTVPYVQWLPDDSLIYVVQSKFTFTFWQVKGSVHKHVAKHQGVFQSARSDAAGRYILFNTQTLTKISQAYALDITNSNVEYQTSLPRYGDHTFIIHFQPTDTEQAGVPDVTATIDDEQMAAFLSKNISAIAGATAKPLKFITTDQRNTIWLDFSTVSGDKKRLLLTVQDATHTEWSISARYHEKSGEWALEQGGVLKTLQPVKVYEWEDDLQQWILKETLDY